MKKIMFNEFYGMQTAVMNRMKTNTRRLVPEQVIIDGKVWAFTKEDPHEALREYILRKSKYKVGEIVAIAQSYKSIEREIEMLGLPLNIKPELTKVPGYENKMYVKAELMPHHILITGINAEHIQDISDEDCLKEGIIPLSDTISVHTPKTVYTYIGGRLFDKPQWAFRSLFTKTGGKLIHWERNEWVYAYEFEFVD